MSTEILLGEIALYYGDKLRRFGATPAGVDWKDEFSQIVRFDQLLKVIEDPSESVVDLGCGFGALLGHMRQRGNTGAYRGVDISAEMIHAARSLYTHEPQAMFEIGTIPSGEEDYALASGIFNVRLGYDDATWQKYILATLAELDKASRRGFAFNCLTSYSDANRMADHLFYGDPCFYFDVCKRAYSRQVALLHDYGLYEFTVIVRKV
jgi:SAM-dependent methyltransferase